MPSVEPSMFPSRIPTSDPTAIPTSSPTTLNYTKVGESTILIIYTEEDYDNDNAGDSYLELYSNQLSNTTTKSINEIIFQNKHKFASDVEFCVVFNMIVQSSVDSNSNCGSYYQEIVNKSSINNGTIDIATTRFVAFGMFDWFITDTSNNSVINDTMDSFEDEETIEQVISLINTKMNMLYDRRGFTATDVLIDYDWELSMNDDDDDNSDPSYVLSIQNLDNNARLTVIITAGVLLVVIMMSSAGYASFGKRYGSDKPNYWLVFLFFESCCDSWTDIIFLCALVVDKSVSDSVGPVLFVLSLLFLIIPYFLSWIGAIYWITKWNRWRHDNPKRLKQYLSKYRAILLLLTVISNFFSSVDLLTSKMFGFDLFYFPLKKNEINSLKNWRFIIVFLLLVCQKFSHFVVFVARSFVFVLAKKTWARQFFVLFYFAW